MAKNLKVGDKVKCINDLAFPKAMNKIGVIVATKVSFLGGTVYGVDFGEHVGGHDLNGFCKYGNGLWYEGEFLKKLEASKPETIVIYRDGKKVIALDKTTGKKGVAKCNPEDTFDFNLGAKLAFDRLMGKPTGMVAPTATKIVKCDKYNVGDKVKVREDLSTDYPKLPHVVEPMLELRGKVCEITWTAGEDSYEITKSDFVWASDMFEGKVVPIDYEEPKKEPKFKKGDIVEVIVDGEPMPKGIRGEVAYVDAPIYTCLVDFKADFYGLHNASGKLPTNTGWWFKEEQLKKVE